MPSSVDQPTTTGRLSALLRLVPFARPYRGLVALTFTGALLASLAELGVQPEKPPYRPGGREDLPNIAFVADPDGYRIELIDGGAFATPQDPPS